MRIRGDRSSGRPQRSTVHCRRGIIAFVAVLGVTLPAWGAKTGIRDPLDYDAARVRSVMRKTVRDVGPMPKELARSFAAAPYSMAHPPEATMLREQPDGRGFAVRMRPFEDGGGQVTLDGYLVTRGSDGWWRYATYGTERRFEPTDAVVLRDGPPAESRASNRPAEIKQALADYLEHKESVREYLAFRHRSMSAAAQAADEPVVFKIPILLFKVNNVPFQEGSTAEKFEKLFSGRGSSPTGTVTEMYLEMSFGNMVVEFEAFGPYEVSISNNAANDCWYGTDGGPVLGDTLGLGGYGAKGMAAEAVPQADPQVNFADFDNDADRYVDFLIMLHSGPGAESTGDPCNVHSHFFSGLTTGFGLPSEPTPPTADGVMVGPVMTIPEVDSAIGVTAHELMHALGEPDYYGTAGTVGLGDWDLGAGGSWLGVPAQSNPMHFNPVIKINLGWIKPTVLTGTKRNVALRPRASHPEMVMIPTRVEPAGSEGAALCDKEPIGGKPGQNRAFYTEDGDCLVEGFIVEHLSRASAAVNPSTCAVKPAGFERQMYGSGLAVWHWDFTNYESLGNNNVLRPMLDLEEFDRRDDTQDLALGITRADPLDLFWGDPVGISGATAVVAANIGLDPPDGSPYTVTAPAPQTSAETPAWTAPTSTPAGVSMTVTLSWETEDVDDWDLVLERKSGDTWVEVASAGAPPASGPEQVAVVAEPGTTYRAVATNYASASPQATVGVEFNTAGVTQLGPAGTLNNELKQTGWQFTNIRPRDYRGISHAAERVGGAIIFDAVKHTAATVDVSGDFVRPVNAEPLVPGRAASFTTVLYNHGGKAVRGATLSVYGRDPVAGGAPIATFRRDLGAYDREVLRFPYTPVAGLNEVFVRAAAPGDMTPANDVVRTDMDVASSTTADVLVVDNDRNWTQDQAITAVLRGLGVRYHIIRGEPSIATMEKYRAVAWLTTTVSGYTGVLSAAAVRDILAYLDGGGRLWLMSSRAMTYLGGADFHNSATILASYFGLAAGNNLLGSSGKATRPQGSGAGASPPVALGYIDGRPYIDYGTMADPAGVRGTATELYRHSAVPEKTIAARVQGDDFRTVYSFPLGMMTNAADRLRFARESLTFLGVPLGAATEAAPAILYAGFQHVQDGRPWTVVAGVFGATSPQIVWRPFGGGAWTATSMKPVGSGLYEGVIPASGIAGNGLEYYIRATSVSLSAQIAEAQTIPEVASAPFGPAANVKSVTCGRVLSERETAPAAPGELPSTGVGELPATGIGIPPWAAGVLSSGVLLASFVASAGRRRRR